MSKQHNKIAKDYQKTLAKLNNSLNDQLKTLEDASNLLPEAYRKEFLNIKDSFQKLDVNKNVEKPIDDLIKKATTLYNNANNNNQ